MRKSDGGNGEGVEEYLLRYLGRLKMAACQCSLTNHRGTFSSIFRQEVRLQIVPDSGAIASLNPCSSITSSYIQILPKSVSTLNT